MDILNFVLGDIHREMVASEITTFGYACPCIPSHSQTCLDLPRVSLGSHGTMVRFKAIGMKD